MTKKSINISKKELLRRLNDEKDFVNWSVELGKRAKKGRIERLSSNN